MKIWTVVLVLVLAGCGRPTIEQQLRAEAEFKASSVTLKLGSLEIVSDSLIVQGRKVADCGGTHSLQQLADNSAVAICGSTFEPELIVVDLQHGTVSTSLLACDLQRSGPRDPKWPWKSRRDLEASGLFSHLGSCN
jgi:hypothetical protein